MTTEQIKEKIKSGDYVTLGQILGITPDNARMRFRRQKKEAIDGMKKIVENRDRLISTANINQ